jgi:tRNA G10  N-methylase Trm11
VLGSLHPPVAAALARLARIEDGHQVLDPFCGAGTILLEARRLRPGAHYTGLDRDPDAIAAARSNDCSPPHVRWQIHDAAVIDRMRTPFDRIITNPPWSVRVGIGPIAPYLDQWRRVLKPGGTAVAIVNHQQATRLMQDPNWRVVESHGLSVAGQHPRIVVATPSAPGHDGRRSPATESAEPLVRRELYGRS